MCGIVLLAGSQAQERIDACLARLQHRGPDDRSVLKRGQLALGFSRLAINGEGALGRQPFAHGALVGAVNGEIYNHRAFATAHGLMPSECDVHVILPLIERLGPRIIDVLDGFYAGVVLRSSTTDALCLRDFMGKKPLFVGRSGGEIFITSELKALSDEPVVWFEPLPRGASSVDLMTGRVTVLAEHRAVEFEGELPTLFEAAVRKRLPSREQPVGVFLSGGLDSSLVAAFVARERPDAIFFTLGEADSADQRAAATVARALGLGDVRAVPQPSREHLPALLRQVVWATESFNPSIVSNGLATYLLADAAHQAGLNVVLTGEGADELFGGYHMFGPEDRWREVRQQLIDDMHFTELRRLDLCSMAHSVEARCPFLDRAVRAFSDSLGYHALYDNGQNKVALRRGFEGMLPEEILYRHKTSFDVGSGVRGEVVRFLHRNGRSEREELQALWREQFCFDASNRYFHAYPVFDAAINERGATHR